MSSFRPAAKAAALAAAFLALTLGVRFFLRISYDSRASILSYRIPATISGDEPHYLLVMNSLLFDHDLDLRPDYDRVAAGGIEAGRRFRNSSLDHHTFWFDRDTRRHGRVTDSDPGPGGASVVERTAHPIGYPAAAALVLAASRTTPAEAESRAELFVTILGVSTIFLTYPLSRAIGAGRTGSILACGLLLLASSWLPYAGSLYSETLQGFLLAAGAIALSRRRALTAGLLFAIAIAVKPALAIVAAAAILVLFRRGRRAEALRLGAVVGGCGAILAAFNLSQTGLFVIIGTATWGGNTTLAGFLRTFVEPAHGLLLFDPWVGVAALSLAGTFREEREDAAVAGQSMAASLAAFAVLLSAYAYTGGDCYGPRYWVPFLPWLAAAAGLAFERGSRGLKISFCAFALAGAVIAIPGTLLRGEARNAGPLPPAESLVRGFPSWSRQIEGVVRLHLKRAGL